MDGKLLTVARWGLVLLFFLLPLFVWPSLGSAEMAKRLLFSGVILAVLILWLIRILIRGEIAVPWQPLVGVSAFGLVATAGSWLFAASQSRALTGDFFDLYSLWFAGALFLLCFLTASLLAERRWLWFGYLSLVVGLIAAWLIQASWLLIPVWRAWSGAVATGTMLGASWGDFSILLGFLAIQLVFALDYWSYAIVGWRRLLGWVTLAAVLFSLLILGQAGVWLGLALVGMLLFAYAVVSHAPRRGASLVLLLVAIGLLVVNQSGGWLAGQINWLAQQLNLVSAEARPAFGVSWDLLKAGLQHHPLMGIGPNQFFNWWQLYKPAAVNQTVFWSADFLSGWSTWLTWLLMTGVLGWLTVLGGLGALAQLFKLMPALVAKIERQPLTPLLFVGLIYFAGLGIWSGLGVNSLIWLVAAAGLLAASLIVGRQQQIKVINFSAHPSLGVIGVIATILLLVGAFWALLILGQQSLGWRHFQRGASMIGQAAGGSALDELTQAAANSPSDVIARTLAQAKLNQLGQLMQSIKTPTPAQNIQVNALIVETLAAGRAALDFDRQNYLNWLMIGQIYETLAGYGVTEAAGQAKAAYDQAATLSPNHPGVKMAQGRLALAQGDYSAAGQFLDQALRLKADFLPAFDVWWQLQNKLGQPTQGRDRLAAAAMQFAPDPSLWFQLGALFFKYEDYKNAAVALTRTLELWPDYPDAHYLLGLSYLHLNDKVRAQQEFKILNQLAPNDPNVQQLLKL